MSNSLNSRLLVVRDLKKYFPVRRGFFQKIIGWIKAVDGVDVTIDKGKTLALVGESGCGKSTVGRLILRLMDADSGQIRFCDRDISNIDQKEMLPLRRQIQIVFQDPFGSLNPRMTIGQSIEEGLKIVGIRSYYKRKDRINQLLSMVGIIPSASDRYPHEFSGGQRQRIGIARALSVEPTLIVCDEPVSALDVSIQAQVINLLKGLQRELGLSYLFIAHDLNVVGYISDTVAVMYLGQIMEYANTEELFDNPLHPYTLALFSAIPSVDRDKRKDQWSLKGEAPSAFNFPPGCKFQGRCPMVEAECKKDEIGFFEAAEGHLVRCWKVK
ncbi:oligopeptide transporter subunit; ATP-binding component of ABC superfamily [uncultured Desulfobacterium sp.]|uniref:Oligopeptide transporter subunit ATP-binding component of ABC superfamily n=1 Tax=uncultured Desulfobacterium sp. TaxID=201089 RepID=A0A445MZN4_9BACT|nr:oligopeptide transporter subunit; ATP-binding component of ABC superfamily [uncultured Desulfobacterium sp.]